MTAIFKVRQQFETYCPAVDDFHGIRTIIAGLQLLNGLNPGTLIGKQDISYTQYQYIQKRLPGVFRGLIFFRFRAVTIRFGLIQIQNALILTISLLLESTIWTAQAMHGSNEWIVLNTSSGLSGSAMGFPTREAS